MSEGGGWTAPGGVAYTPGMAAHVETASELPATYADIERLPPHVIGEILAGELVVSPRPAPPHARAASVLGALLGSPFDLGVGGPGGWWIIFEPELSLGVDPGYDPVVPDLAGWRHVTMPDQPETAQYHVIPDWVCEVVSPASARHDRVRKLSFYGRAGIRHAWLVDPLAETLEVYRLDDGVWGRVLAADGPAKVHAEPFDAIELDLALLWKRRTSTPEPDQRKP